MLRISVFLVAQQLNTYFCVCVCLLCVLGFLYEIGFTYSYSMELMSIRKPIYKVLRLVLGLCSDQKNLRYEQTWQRKEWSWNLKKALDIRTHAHILGHSHNHCVLPYERGRNTWIKVSSVKCHNRDERRHVWCSVGQRKVFNQEEHLY